jgi:hypothetical protein
MGVPVAMVKGDSGLLAKDSWAKDSSKRGRKKVREKQHRTFIQAAALMQIQQIECLRDKLNVAIENTV